MTGGLVFIDPNSATPLFEQIVRQVAEAVRTGQLPVGTRLPTVRQLAADLGVHPNTVAKAYRQLEAEGHVETFGRNGTRVRARQEEPGAEEVQAAAVLLARASRRSGYTLDQAMGVLRHAW